MPPRLQKFLGRTLQNKIQFFCHNYFVIANAFNLDQSKILLCGKEVRDFVIKGGYLDFSHLTDLKKIYISLKFIWKNNTNHQELRIIKLQDKKFLVFPYKATYRASDIFQDWCAKMTHEAKYGRSFSEMTRPII